MISTWFPQLLHPYKKLFRRSEPSIGLVSMLKARNSKTSQHRADFGIGLRHHAVSGGRRVKGILWVARAPRLVCVEAWEF